MASIIVLFLCLILGYLFKKNRILPKETPLVLNQFLIYISLPALALFYLPQVEISSKLLFPVGVAWLGFLGAAIMFFGLGRIFKWPKALTACLVIMTGLGNTSFVGIPVIESLYGKEALKTLVMVDLPGTFMVLSTLGIWVAASNSNSNINFKEILKRIFKFPPFIAFCFGISMAILSIQLPIIISDALALLATTVTPLALVSVGYQLTIQRRSKHWGFLFLGLTYKLIIWPLGILILYHFVFNQSGTFLGVCVLEAGMAPMVTASVIASTFNLKPRFSSMMVGVGIIVSVFTLAFWYCVLSWI